MVSSIFYVHPYLGKIPILINIFQMGWNHQPDKFINILRPCKKKTRLQPGEKRNATEIMHAYVGSGIEVLADKGAPCMSCLVVVDGCE